MDEQQIWKVLKDYYDNVGLIGHQISSFDYFLNQGIQNVINEEPDIVIPTEKGEYIVSFGQVYISQPSIIDHDRKLKEILPSDARLRDLYYDSSINCDITDTIKEDGKVIETTLHRRINIGRVPIMLGTGKCNLVNLTLKERIIAGECEMDKGGYFIIKGNERVLVNQIRAKHNHVVVLKQKPDDKFNYIAEMRSMSEETGHSVLIQAKIGHNDKNVCVSLPYIKEPIGIGIVFKALGYIQDDEIINLIGLDTEKASSVLKFIIRDSFFIKDQKSALKYIGNYAMHIIGKEKRRDYSWQVVETELFPHLGVSATIKDKAIMMGKMINKLLSTSLDLRGVDNRDNYSNKRVETAGTLCTELFKTLFKRFTNTIVMQLEKKKQRLDVITIISRMKGITQGIRHCFATGNWGVQKNSYIRTGVSQVLSRLTYGATISHLRRLIIPIGKEGKNSDIRQIHCSQFSYLCPSETPEGGQAGIVLNYSNLATVTKRIPTVLVKSILEKLLFPDYMISLEDCDIKKLKYFVYVFLNGILLGVTEDGDEIVQQVIKLRNHKQIDNTISVTYDSIDEEVNIYSDDGRLIRPLFTVNKNGELNIKKEHGSDWEELVRKDFIRYVDNSEIENCVIAMWQKDLGKQENDYCEIQPSMLLGVMGSVIPFPDHSQSPRNCYQCSMGKQALGTYAMSYKQRTDTTVHVLDYGQKPIVTTKPATFMGFDEMPYGMNCIVAVLTYTGFNQEDSIIMNQSSIDLGLFVTTSYRTVTDSEKKRGNYISETICVPPQNSAKNIKDGDSGYFRRRNGNYSMLDKNGIIKKGVHVKQGDILIGKIAIKSTKNGDVTKTDCSTAAKAAETGIVDRIYSRLTPNGYRLVKIVMRQHRIPEPGDKLASRAAQKGTVGITYRREDMPFNRDGISPDLIINPHCLPSRMTVNQLMETTLGKSCLMEGTFGDATPFTPSSLDSSKQICERLAKHGFERTGWEYLTCGITGQPIKAKVFMGPTYYQRLKHMVSDKIHSRSQGNVTMLTRQPLEGRSRDGGLRFGEMERDCMIAHGNSRFIKERLFEMSDPFTVVVCDKCGMIASSIEECLSCKTDKMSRVNLPYASKLLFSELAAMSIKMEIEAEK